MTNATPNQAENTRYGYKNDEGHILHIATIGHNRDHVELAIKGIGDLHWRSLNIPATEAAGVALAILKAAGFALGSHRRDSDGAHEIVDTAAGMLADAVRIGEKNKTHGELTRRRDELAAEYTAVSSYNGQLPYTKNLIDRIISEQDAKQATK